MPAINPSVLKKKVDAIFANTVKASPFARQVEELLGFYADRTLRTSVTASALESADVLHVPAPVLRALCTKIHQRGRDSDDEWLAAAQQLWDSGVHEMRLVAICMLGEASMESTLTIASRWAAQAEDIEVLRSLASKGSAAWRHAGPNQMLNSIRNWITGDSTQVFGLIVLQQAIQDDYIADLQAVFNMLSGLTSRARGYQWDALQALLFSLAERSAAETTAFLLDEISEGDARTSRLARTLIEKLPAPFQSQLRTAIKG